MGFASSVILAVLGSNVDGFTVNNVRAARSSLNIATDYSDELKATAASIVRPGFGLLACDESTGTVGTRLESIGLVNTEENRAEWRELLFTTKDLGNHISGAILFEETLFQTGPCGKPMVELLAAQGIIPGIKVDSGLKDLCGSDGETWCSGLDGLYEKCCKSYEQGARFAKWRTAVRIDTKKGFPTDYAIDECAHGLSRYARICQEAGLVPIVEPEILIDGVHEIAKTAKIQERVIVEVYKKLQDCGVMLEGTLLKPSMTVNGVDCENKASPTEVAELTVQTFERSIPAAMPGVTFLSGGISEEDSSIFLNAINSIERKGPWRLTFFFQSCVAIFMLEDLEWKGRKQRSSTKTT